MDPNQALADLLELAADLRAIIDSGEDPDEPGEYYRIASEAVEKFEGLHGWLTRGGFLPAAWTPARLDGP